jgi:hypothetical protein
MVGNLLHQATPEHDPLDVAQAIAESGIWVPVHLCDRPRADPDAGRSRGDLSRSVVEFVLPTSISERASE